MTAPSGRSSRSKIADAAAAPTSQQGSPRPADSQSTRRTTTLSDPRAVSTMTFPQRMSPWIAAVARQPPAASSSAAPTDRERWINRVSSEAALGCRNASAAGVGRSWYTSTSGTSAAGSCVTRCECRTASAAPMPAATTGGRPPSRRVMTAGVSPQKNSVTRTSSAGSHAISRGPTSGHRPASHARTCRSVSSGRGGPSRPGAFTTACTAPSTRSRRWRPDMSRATSPSVTMPEGSTSCRRRSVPITSVTGDGSGALRPALAVVLLGPGLDAGLLRVHEVVEQRTRHETGLGHERPRYEVVPWRDGWGGQRQVRS